MLSFCPLVVRYARAPAGGTASLLFSRMPHGGCAAGRAGRWVLGRTQVCGWRMLVWGWERDHHKRATCKELCVRQLCQYITGYCPRVEATAGAKGDLSSLLVAVGPKSASDGVVPAAVRTCLLQSEHHGSPVAVPGGAMAHGPLTHPDCQAHPSAPHAQQVKISHAIFLGWRAKGGPPMNPNQKRR